MFNPFWTLGRTASLILPSTRDYYDVCDHDGTKRPVVDNVHHFAFYKNPRVSLQHPVRQVFEICGVPWVIAFADGMNKNSKFKVHYSRSGYEKTSMRGHANDCADEVLHCLKPYICVRAKDFLLLEQAFEDFRVRMESEKAKESVKRKTYED